MLSFLSGYDSNIFTDLVDQGISLATTNNEGHLL